MKRWLGFIAIFVALLIPMPVMAGNVSPFVVALDVSAGGFTEQIFTLSGFNEVDVFLENISLAVEPNHSILVIDGKITVRILGDLSKPTQTYVGYLVILESGQQVGSGVKVNLTVNHINNQSVMLSATVLSSSSGYHGNYGGSSYYNPYLSLLKKTEPSVVEPTEPVPVTPEPAVTPPPAEPLPQVTPAVGVPMPAEQGTIHIGWFLIGGGILIIGFAMWYLWDKRRKLKKIESS